MPFENDPGYVVAVIGAGPAGLFAAKQLAAEGVHVALLNRDIKPGGLAEYGIYPDKHKMKDGLRAQFRQILSSPLIRYYGNVTVGKTGDISVQDIRSAGFDAILVTAGAQGTKWLGLPGEQLTGVYHAKNLVYYYNQLPPFSQEQVEIGRRVAIVGAGNVMLDIAHYMIGKRKVDEVIAVARRGPNEAKYEKKELESVAANLDMNAVEAEIARLTPLMLGLGQDPQAPLALLQAACVKAEPTESNSRFTIRFLASPVQILGNEAGRVVGLEVEENTLLQVNGDVKAQGLGIHRILDVDTVVFAIGDRVDENFGLPMNAGKFIICNEPNYPIDGISYEACDPESGCSQNGIFLAGWSRQASTGLVGVARKDGTNGAKAVMQFLHTLPPTVNPGISTLERLLDSSGKTVVNYGDIQRLEEIERQEAQRHGAEEFKFDSNEEMLAAIERVEKAK
jgi:ferredoxin--NADP+ reductase